MDVGKVDAGDDALADNTIFNVQSWANVRLTMIGVQMWIMSDTDTDKQAKIDTIHQKELPGINIK